MLGGAGKALDRQGVFYLPVEQNAPTLPTLQVSAGVFLSPGTGGMGPREWPGREGGARRRPIQGQENIRSGARLRRGLSEGETPEPWEAGG